MVVVFDWEGDDVSRMAAAGERVVVSAAQLRFILGIFAKVQQRTIYALHPGIQSKLRSRSLRRNKKEPTFLPRSRMKAFRYDKHRPRGLFGLVWGLLMFCAFLQPHTFCMAQETNKGDDWNNNNDKMDHDSVFLHHARDLRQHVVEGMVHDVLQIKLRHLADDKEYPKYADTIVEATDGFCHKPRRIFPEAQPEQEAKMKAFGLTRWYQASCLAPPGQKASAATNTATDNVRLPGERAEQAVLKLQALVQRDGPQVLGLERVTVETDMMLFDNEPHKPHRSSSSFSPPPHHHHHHHDRRTAQQDTLFSNDPLRNEQDDFFQAIDLYAAWDLMQSTGAWKYAPNIVVHVQDSGAEITHEDLNGMSNLRSCPPVAVVLVDDGETGFSLIAAVSMVGVGLMCDWSGTRHVVGQSRGDGLL